MPETRRYARALPALALAALALALALSGASVEGALFLFPAIALAGCLTLRRYPGERRLTALTSRGFAAAGRRRPAPARRPRSAGPGPRVGLLFEFALANRPPPALLAR